MAQTQSSGETLLHLLESRSCDFCGGGVLERGTYKGSRAVVCESCGAPAAQIFDD